MNRVGFLGLLGEPAGPPPSVAVELGLSDVIRSGLVMMWIFDIVLEARVGWSGGTKTPS